MRYLTDEQVLFLHARLIAETGGSHGVRDLGMLQSAVARPQASFEGADLYPDLCTQAAALFDSLVRNHPFVDGNKRTAITAAALFLKINGRRLMALNDQVVAFTLAAALGKMTIAVMADWLQQHSIEE
jgi:death-on-curing protein